MKITQGADLLCVLPTILMAETQGFALLFAAAMILTGIPMLLLGILELSQPSAGFVFVGLGIGMLFIGAIFLMVILTQK